MKIGIKSCLAVLSLAGVYAIIPSQEPSRTAPIDQELVLQVKAKSGFGGSAAPIARRDGKLYYLTAGHLGPIETVGDLEVLETITHPENGQDPEKDLALIVVDDQPRVALIPLADEDASTGDIVFVAGWQMGRFLMVTQGYRGAQEGSYSAPTTQGSSGGPVLNAEGDLIGVAMSVVYWDPQHYIPHIGFYQALDLDWLRGLGVID